MMIAAMPTTAIILGCTINPDESLSPLARERLDAAVQLFKSGAVTRLVMSGGKTLGAEETFTEAAALTRAAIDAGIPPENILLETQSTSTIENARNCAALLGSPTIYLVTQPFHMTRAAFWFRRFGFTVIPYPADSPVQRQSPVWGLYWTVKDLGILVYTYIRYRFCYNRGVTV